MASDKTGLDSLIKDVKKVCKDVSEMKSEGGYIPKEYIELKNKLFLTIVEQMNNIRSYHLNAFGDLEPEFEQKCQEIFRLMSSTFGDPLSCNHAYVLLDKMAFCVSCGCYRNLNQKEAEC